MGEKEVSTEDSPSKKSKDSERFGRANRGSLKKDECCFDISSPKSGGPPAKKRRLDQDSDSKIQSDLNDVSPVVKSRYGRTHKPKIPEDFLPTDKKVAAILGHSPKSPNKGSGSPNITSSSEIANVRQKGRKIFDIFVKKERQSKGNTEFGESESNVNPEKKGASEDSTQINVKKEMEGAVNNEVLDPIPMVNVNIPPCDWVIGDLAWARVSGYPYWPCMIALDPEQGYFTRIMNRGHSVMRAIHVQFFGDNGRRSWLFVSCVIPFEGLEALNKLSEKLQSEPPKKKKSSKKLASAFVVTPKAKTKWDVAVREAEESLPKTRDERVEDFATRFPRKQKKNKLEELSLEKEIENSQSNSDKKRVSTSKSPRSPKTPKNKKREPVTPRSASPILGDDNDKDWTPSLSASQISSDKDKKSSPQVQKKKPYRKPKSHGADFKAFLCKQFDRVTQEHPELSAKAIERYLVREWNTMDEHEKSLFSARFNDTTTETELSSNGEEIEEEEEDDVEERQSSNSEKTESTENRDSSPAAFVKLKKSGGLFRGIKQERVCVICEKPGETVKCRGSCCGTFHINCLSKSLIEKEMAILMSPTRMIKKRPSSVTRKSEGNENVKSAELTAIKTEEDSKLHESENDEQSSKEVIPPIESEEIVKFDAEKELKVNVIDISKQEKTDEDLETGKKKSENIKTSENSLSDKEQDSIQENNHVVSENLNGESSISNKNSEEDLNEKIDENSEIKSADNEKTTSIASSTSTSEEEQKISENSSDVRSVEENSDLKDSNENKLDSKENKENTDADAEVTGSKSESILTSKEKRISLRRKLKDDVEEKKTEVKDEKENTVVKQTFKMETRGIIKSFKEVKKEKRVSSVEKSKEERSSNKKKEKTEKKVKNEKESMDEKESTENLPEYRCKDCIDGRFPPCLSCGSVHEEKTGRDNRQRCAIVHCGKFYHSDCLKLWPHAWSSGGASRRHSSSAKSVETGTGKIPVICPQHVCHTCASDDPRNVTTRFNHERLVRCIRCPTAYHTGNYCLPAGSEILTGTQIICPNHYEPPQKRTYHVNAAWCFICAMGGTLICCDLCPTSFHAECLKISAPEGSFICEDCDTGRFPLYGEIVWVKLGAYRWWPAQILYPSQIPDNINNLPHVRGEFAVRFFGSHDHYWVNRGRVFLYQEGDTGHSKNRKSYVEGLFSRALEEASAAQKILKGEKATREAESRPVMKPPMYVKIKSNRPVGNVRVTEMDPSSMTPCDCNPKSENPCGKDSDCLNRILLVECSSAVCTAGEKCKNQCFEKREYPPLVPYRTESRGWGLKTLAAIKKGDFVIEYVGEMIDEAEYQRRMTRKHEEKDENYYFLTIDKDRMLDAGPKGNVARFMNHSCQPNCETQKWTVNGDTRVGLFALVDIAAETELTFNYNLECVGPDKKPCMCGATNCRGFIGIKGNKQQEEDKKVRMDLQELSKKSKKRRSSMKMNSDVCFICNEPGDLLFCDNKTCPKGYHLSCLKLKKSPQDKWLCPWHRCNVCKKRTIKRCTYCLSSYCPQHAEGNIRNHPTLGLVCQKHDDKVSSEATSAVVLGEPDKMEIEDKMEIDDETSKESTPDPESTSVDESMIVDNEGTNETGYKSMTENSGVKEMNSENNSLETTSAQPIEKIPAREDAQIITKITSLDKSSKPEEIETEDKSSDETKYNKDSKIALTSEILSEKGITEVKSVNNDIATVSSSVINTNKLNSNDSLKKKRGRPRKTSIEEKPVICKEDEPSSEEKSVGHEQVKSTEEKPFVPTKQERSSSEEKPVVHKRGRSSSQEEPRVRKQRRSLSQEEPRVRKQRRSLSEENTVVQGSSSEEKSIGRKQRRSLSEEKGSSSGEKSIGCKRGRSPSEEIPVIHKRERSASHEGHQFNKADLDNELESLALSFTDGDNTFYKKTPKASKRQSMKPQTTPKDNKVTMNGTSESAKKRKEQQRKISSYFTSKPRCKLGDVDADKPSNDAEPEIDENKTKVQKYEQSHAEDTEVQKTCNETKSSVTECVSVNGIDTSSILLPVES